MIDGVNCPRDGRLRSERGPEQRADDPGRNGSWIAQSSMRFGDFR